ncbi:MAG: hypothetical protein ACPGLY_24170 [Rubripirellula sp.]
MKFSIGNYGEVRPFYRVSILPASKTKLRLGRQGQAPHGGPCVYNQVTYH